MSTVVIQALVFIAKETDHRINPPPTDLNLREAGGTKAAFSIDKMKIQALDLQTAMLFYHLANS